MDRNIHVFTGLLVLAGAGVLLIAIAIVPMLTPAPTPPKTFIAYLDESGGIREGDAVRISGRRAGRVTSVKMVRHEDKLVARVEFIIQAGTGSPWLNELADTGIPHDSSIRVRQPRMLGRPRLDISIGSDASQTIADGGEWKNARGAGGDDEMTGWKQDIDRARQQIAQFQAFLDNRELFESLNAMLRETTKTLLGLEESFARNLGLGDRIAGTLDDLTRSMDSTTASLRRQREQEQPLEPLVDQLARMDEQLSAFDESVNRIEQEIQRLESDSASALSGTDRDKLAGMGLELRRQSARLRSSMVTAKGNPKKFGDMPGWRGTRPFYHGGQPPTGTSIDDEPPPPPGDGAGVPGR